MYNTVLQHYLAVEKPQTKQFLHRYNVLFAITNQVMKPNITISIKLIMILLTFSHYLVKNTNKSCTYKTEQHVFL